MRWKTVTIETLAGVREAVAPEVISASRATDLPAFHADWFMRRLRAGYAKWINPFNGRAPYVSFARLRAIAFFTKNPAPMLPFLQELEERGIAYYFHFTVNDYDAEGFEPHVPDLDKRVTVFRELAERIGRHRVIWRFDPLLLAGGLEPHDLLAKVQSTGDRLHEYTDKLVFSFADISSYAKVQRSLRAAGVPYREFSADEQVIMGREIGRICRAWGITPTVCGEEIDLTAYGVEKSRCIDDELLLRISHNDPALVDRFGYNLQPNLFETPARRAAKDPGQRKACCCAVSKDIGQYNTCPHLCVYCYAHTSPAVVHRNVEGRKVDRESITG